MMFPPEMSRLILAVALCAGLFLAEQGHVPDTTPPEQAAQTEGTTPQNNGDLKVILKPGFDKDRISQAEIELIGKFLPEILHGISMEKKKSGG